MSYTQKLSKFEFETERFLPDSLCHYIQKDLIILENVSPEEIRINEIISDVKIDITEINNPLLKEITDIEKTSDDIKPILNYSDELWENKIDGEIINNDTNK